MLFLLSRPSHVQVIALHTVRVTRILGSALVSLFTLGIRAGNAPAVTGVIPLATLFSHVRVIALHMARVTSRQACVRVRTRSMDLQPAMHAGPAS